MRLFKHIKQEAMNKEEEKAIINAAREFAEVNDVHFDDMTDAMICNSIRETVASLQLKEQATGYERENGICYTCRKDTPIEDWNDAYGMCDTCLKDIQPPKEQPNTEPNNRTLKQNLQPKEQPKEQGLQRLWEWLNDDNREPANTKFTSGLLRNVAREIQYIMKTEQPKEQEKTDPIVNAVIDKFAQRSKVGIEKYGTTLAENNTDDFLNHLHEELMDAVLYIEKLKNI